MWIKIIEHHSERSLLVKQACDDAMHLEITIESLLYRHNILLTQTYK